MKAAPDPHRPLPRRAPRMKNLARQRFEKSSIAVDRLVNSELVEYMPEHTLKAGHHRNPQIPFQRSNIPECGHLGAGHVDALGIGGFAKRLLCQLIRSRRRHAANIDKRNCQPLDGDHPESRVLEEFLQEQILVLCERGGDCDFLYAQTAQCFNGAGLAGCAGDGGHLGDLAGDLLVETDSAVGDRRRSSQNDHAHLCARELRGGRFQQV